MKRKHIFNLIGCTFLMLLMASSCLQAKSAKQFIDNEKQFAGSSIQVVPTKYDPYTPFIIIDKDGYTNIREKPDANSKIVGKINKYQLFFSIDGDFCGSGMFATDNWEPIESDGNPNGYIYKKNILRIDSLPYLMQKENSNFTLSSDSTAIIVIANDSIQITMRLQPFNKYNHSNSPYGGSSDDIKENIDYNIKTEIKEIEIVCNGQKTILPKDKIYEYCDIGYMGAWVGFDGEIYFTMGGGSQAAWYGVWFSIVGGEIVYETMINNCW